MNLTQAYKRFDIDKILSRIEDLNSIDMFDDLQREITSAEGVRIPSRKPNSREIDALQVTYISNLKSLAFILHTGEKPAAPDETTLLKFKRIIEKLVLKGQLKKSILDNLN